MNEKQIQTLKRCLKDNGVKNFETIARGALSLNYNKYLDLAEPIYVISRIQPYINGDNDREKTIKAQKQWLNIVIENDWCTALTPYVSAHGKTLVSMAVEYCIGNGLWDSPKGNAALRTHQPDHYAGLDVIDEAAEYLKGEGFVDDSDNTTTEKPVPSHANEEKFNDNTLIEGSIEWAENIIDNIPETNLSEEAIKFSLDYLKRESVSRLYLLYGIERYFDKIGRNPSEVICENEKLHERISNLETALQSKNADLGKAKDERNDVQQKYNQKSQEYDRIVKVKREQAEVIQSQGNEINRLKRELKESQDAVERQKQATALPRVRVFKESELRSIPLVGDKVLSGLEIFFSKNNIVIDHNK